MSTSFNDLNLQILQNVACFVGFKDVATYSVINRDTSAATRQIFGQLRAEVSELDTTFGTNRSSYHGEARCLLGLRAAGWTIQRWENVSEQVRSGFGLAELKPDAVRLDIGPVVVDFFRIKISTGNPKADAQTREQQRLDSVPSSINSLVNNASRKFSKYSGKAYAVADCSEADLPVQVLSDVYINSFEQEAQKKTWPAGATVWFVRDMEVRVAFHQA
jgi:hypothetical protein